jgi:hypothetical protein
VDAKAKFSSTFMRDYLQRSRYPEGYSSSAQAVYNAGLALWRYYHQSIKNDDSASVDASLYEIREYFKGRNASSRMNSRSADPQFTALDTALKEALEMLSMSIQPKVYEYGFLKRIA